jgi:hypothetical protein
MFISLSLVFFEHKLGGFYRVFGIKQSPVIQGNAQVNADRRMAGETGDGFLVVRAERRQAMRT